MANRGRPAYMPTDEEVKLLGRLRYLTDRSEKISTQREALIEGLILRKIPALQIARAARIHPSALSMRFKRRKEAS